jgi:hypothetical protein
MRFAPALLMIFALGCVAQNNPPAVEAERLHPPVRVQGIDGTIFNGELLNGSVTVDSGQGALTLLTQHIRAIDFTPEADTVDSASVKVSGKVKESTFMLKSEHGVFTLMKERLRKIEFTHSSPPTPNGTTALTASHSTSTRPRQALIIP